MRLTFEPIAGPAGLSKQTQYTARLSRCEQVTSDYSFLNLWGWAEEYGLTWAWEADLVWIKQSRPAPAYWAPIGSWKSIEWPQRLATHFSESAHFIRMPALLRDILDGELQNNLRIYDARGQWDYLYSVKDLAQLKGNRFHKKRNLVNQFKKKYNYTYVPLGSGFAQKALGMQEDWCLWRDCESIEALAAENRVIEKILNHWDAFDNLMGAGIMVDSRLVAYTVAEPLPNDMILIHFEKGSTQFKGVYQAINQMFLEQVQTKFSLVNREQDLDDPGLRKAKLSYHPSDFIKKYQVIYN